MILIVDCNLKTLKISVFKKKDKRLSSECFSKDMDEIRDDESFKKYIQIIIGKNKIKAISFRILFGGDYFDKPVLIDPIFFVKFEKLTDAFPFYVPVMMETIKRFIRVFKNKPLIAFFETAYFLKLPDEERFYAMPFEYYRDNKIKKCGFHGILHEENSKKFSEKDKTISIVFDSQTTVCSISGKKPLSVSLGYTPLEGVMSRTSSGDVDPGIVFYLMNVHNFSIYKIDEMLKKESGFLGLTGHDIELKDMVKLLGKDVKVDQAFDIYQAQIMKYIGEGISVMGGVDNIIFAGSNVNILIPVIYSIVKKISFLGINTKNLPWGEEQEIIDITTDESKIKTFINKIDIAKVIFNESVQNY
ncbi:MAG: hypothetical protein HQL29_00690 [Candidatus Omnitrophica bacterium]|nr:hypothetical protein [Candidatus Omnitrophota bacterium]